MHRYGPPSVIALVIDAPRPTPTADQLLVRIHSTTVNPADCKQRSGNLKLVLSHKFPVTFGQDFAGIVETAPLTSQFKTGDEVCARPYKTVPTLWGNEVHVLCASSARYICKGSAVSCRVPDY